LKAAILPLYCWLPAAYASTSAPVAALFALLTKVGVYAILRIFPLVFGPEFDDWLLPLGLATLLAGGVGVLASQELRRLIAYSVIVSVGAALMYLVHTTLITAGLFLLADLIANQRGHSESRPAAPVAQPRLLGGLFFIGAMALAGLPPLSGFLGKVLLLQASGATAAQLWVWSIVLGSSLLMLVALARMGSSLFWTVQDDPATTAIAAPVRRWWPAAALLAAGPLLMLFGQPLIAFTTATAGQLSQPLALLESLSWWR